MLSTLTGLAGWAYLLVVLLVVTDAVFPLIPGELAVVSGGVLAAAGRLDLPVLLVAAAVGAMAGDTLAYTMGRGASRLGVGRLLRQRRSRRGLVWATERLHRRAVPVLVAGRFIPGGRTVTTLVAGFLRVPPRRFALAVAIGGPIWASYATLLGYFAGRATADHPWTGVLAAFTVMTLAGLAAEGIRRLRARRHGQPAATSPVPSRAAASPAVPSPALSTPGTVGGRRRPAGSPAPALAPFAGSAVARRPRVPDARRPPDGFALPASGLAARCPDRGSELTG
jgi:membrane protein DedA with SNARE-associated domain